MHKTNLHKKRGGGGGEGGRGGEESFLLECILIFMCHLGVALSKNDFRCSPIFKLRRNLTSCLCTCSVCLCVCVCGLVEHVLIS